MDLIYNSMNDFLSFCSVIKIDSCIVQVGAVFKIVREHHLKSPRRQFVVVTPCKCSVHELLVPYFRKKFALCLKGLSFVDNTLS